MLVIRAAQLIDGTGAAPIQNAVIVVEGERITQVGPADHVSIPAAAEVIDASDKTVLPGLIDVHVHVHSPGEATQMHQYALSQVTQTQGLMALNAFAYSRQTLRRGFTALRSVSSPAYVDVALRDAINRGMVEGPRLQVSGQGLTITGGHMDSRAWSPEVTIAGRTGVCDGPWACRRAAREQIKRGVDLIKINAAVSNYSTDYTHVEPFHQEMTYEEMAAICEEAHWAGMRVAAHAHGGQGITDAIRAGLDSVEHAPWLTDEQIERMVEHNVFYVPTLTVHTFLKELGQKEVGMPDAAWNWLLKVCDDRWDTLARAKRAGVKIAAGTDAGFFVPHGENAAELAELVKGDFTPMEAIVAATQTAAECMGWEREIGTVEAGKYADLVVVDGDPLDDIGILRRADKIERVFKGGQTVAQNA
jgi:imidazolonepropionase-like amidohydrolase